LYNNLMSARRFRRILGIMLLLLSLALLIWGLWPFAELTRSTIIPAGDIQLPTPESFIWMAQYAI